MMPTSTERRSRWIGRVPGLDGMRPRIVTVRAVLCDGAASQVWLEISDGHRSRRTNGFASLSVEDAVMLADLLQQSVRDQEHAT